MTKGFLILSPNWLIPLLSQKRRLLRVIEVALQRSTGRTAVVNVYTNHIENRGGAT